MKITPFIFRAQKTGLILKKNEKIRKQKTIIFPLEDKFSIIKKEY